MRFRLAAMTGFVMFVSVLAWSQRGVEQVHGRPVAAGEMLVKFQRPTSDGIRDLQRAADADRMELVGGTGAMLLHSRSMSTAQLLERLSSHPGLAYAEPNGVVFGNTTTPNDPQFPSLYALYNTGQSIAGVSGTAGADIGASRAWDITTGTRSVVVGVMDTGVDYTHPDLAANIWSAPTSFTVNIGGTAITCPAGSHGFNAILKTCDPMDDNDHGTHVSGTIGAAGNNGVGVVGVNWATSIMGLKFLNASNYGYYSDAINTIEFAIQAKNAFAATGAANVRVLNNSWGGTTYSQALADEFTKAGNNNMLVPVAAMNNSANNDTTPEYPASFTNDNIIAVAATDNNDQLASFSDYGPTSVDLGAPGWYVYSTIRGGGYAWYNGTSMATPQVSGAAALILSVCNLNYSGLRAVILNNVDPVASLAGKTVTGGRLNVYKAISACRGNVSPDFTLAASPSSQTLTQGYSAAYTLALGAVNGFTGTTTFAVSGLPAGATASFSPASLSGAGASTMTIATASSTPAGTYAVVVTGTSGGLVHTTTVSLSVQTSAPPPSPGFTLTSSPASATTSRGGTVGYNITVTPTNGFSGTVSLSVSGLPSGASASFSPATVASTGGTNLTVTAGNQKGNFTLTISGVSGSVSSSTNVTLKVTR